MSLCNWRFGAVPLVAPYIVSRAIAFHPKIFKRLESMQVSILWLRRGVVKSVRCPRLKTCVPALEVVVTLVIRYPVRVLYALGSG